MDGQSPRVTRAVLLRFHKAPLVCRSRVALLRELNPGVPVYGVFGGNQSVTRLVGRRLVGLDGLYAPNPRRKHWMWLHHDLVVRAWFRDVGSSLPFDVLHVVEWDLLLVEPLGKLYASVPEGAVGLTALTPVSELRDWTWLRRDEERRNWERLLDVARSQWGYDGVPFGCVCGGPVFPRAFLEAYASVDPPVIAHDELRLPLFAQILGFPVVDSGLRGPWRGEREHAFFHFRAPEIELETIRAELAKPDGARAFHPVRVKVDREMIFG
jgi:hypothetical protein